MNNNPFLLDSDSLSEEIALLKERVPSILTPMSPLPTEESAQLKKIKAVRAVLFDIYGTLLISGTGDISIAQERANLYSIDQILEKNGLIPLHEDINYIHKQRFTEEISRIHKEKNNSGVDYPEVDILEVWYAVLERLLQEEMLEGALTPGALVNIAMDYELMVNPVWPMPGTNELLTSLSRRNLQQGIVSNAQFYTLPSLESLLKSSLTELGMDPMLWSWSYQCGKAKPSLDIFSAPLQVLGKRGIKPEEVLYVGNDMLNDVTTAKRCGCKTALFAGDSRSLRLRKGDLRCKGIEADIVITNLAQLEECL